MDSYESTNAALLIRADARAERSAADDAYAAAYRATDAALVALNDAVVRRDRANLAFYDADHAYDESLAKHRRGDEFEVAS